MVITDGSAFLKKFDEQNVFLCDGIEGAQVFDANSADGTKAMERVGENFYFQPVTILEDSK